MALAQSSYICIITPQQGGHSELAGGHSELAGGQGDITSNGGGGGGAPTQILRELPSPESFTATTYG